MIARNSQDKPITAALAVLTSLLGAVFLIQPLDAATQSPDTNDVVQDIELWTGDIPEDKQPPPLQLPTAGDFKRIMLTAHNQFRDKESAASNKNIKHLEWDDRLASQSLSLAELCKFQHSKADGTSRQKNEGENIWKGHTIDGFLNAVESWYNEKSAYNYSKNRCKMGYSCGHYKQVVWGKTKKVGCGYQYCVDESHILVFCQYKSASAGAKKPY
ncbi:peptidase inhibitor 16-like [Tubulanus polymorphus]|uniref:peptidase inhibitor 16-like n=1 Tax=Tubulanus polymorphus TaxID=672921 RepID=UPI003DA4451F